MTRWARTGLAVLAAVVLLAGCGVFSNVEDVVGDSYQRAANLDDGTARAYSAVGLAPAAVAGAIAGRQQPLDRLSVGGREYLQYDEYLVRVQQAGAGSTVLVDDYENGYRRWASDVGAVWAPQAPGGGEGK